MTVRRGGKSTGMGVTQTPDQAPGSTTSSFNTQIESMLFNITSPI